MRAVLAGLACLAAGSACAAAPAYAAAPESGGDVEEMARLFDTLCIQAFPDDAALAAATAPYRARALTPAQVRSYLHEDPGRGWSITTATATYVVTLELPPYHACAVRRMTGLGFASVAPYQEAIRAYAAAHHASLVPAGQQNGRAPDGAEITATAQRVTPAPATEMFMTFFTDYHGRYTGPFATDIGKSGSGVEVRFIHQFPPARP